MCMCRTGRWILVDELLEIDDDGRGRLLLCGFARVTAASRGHWMGIRDFMR